MTAAHLEYYCELKLYSGGCQVVEQIQETIQISLQRRTASSWQSAYLRVVFILFTGFALTGIGVMALAQSIQPALPSFNPFLDYADIFPGQPLNTLEPRTFSCWNSNNYYASFDSACSVTPLSALFTHIDISISDGIIRQITFLIGEDTLKAGNLILLFGNPNFHAYPRKVFFFWNNLFVIVSTTDRGNPASMRPVWSVTFAST